jgi:hypothetical protein
VIGQRALRRGDGRDETPGGPDARDGEACDGDREWNLLGLVRMLPIKEAT